MQTIITRIEDRLKALDMTPEALSKKAGLSRDYIRQLRMHPDRSPRGKSLTQLATALQVSEQWLLTGETIPAGPPAESGAAPTLPTLPTQQMMPLNVPVMGTAAGSHLRGAFQFEGGVIDFVRRPPALQGARDIYALFVEGSSMEPQYFPGDLIYINPHKPARIGDVVVIQEANGDDVTITASLGVLEKRASGKITLKKHNPPSSLIAIEGGRVRAIHKVLTINELFGV